MFTDLDTSTVDPEAAAIFATEFLVWWQQAGRVFYGQDDDGLKAFANDVVSVVGGWKCARRILRSTNQRTMTLIEGKGQW